MLTVEDLCCNKQFINDQIKRTPHWMKSKLTNNEIRSELNLAICTCIKTFNSKRGNIFGYVRSVFINNMRRAIRNNQFFTDIEAPLDAAYGLTYKEKEPEEIELLAYLSSLPDPLLESLTEFVMGKKNKDEIVSNPSFKKLNIDRIIDKLDSLL